MARLNSTAKVAFFNARKRAGDVSRIASTTGYSETHIINVLAGRRNAPETVANTLYKMARRRMVTN